VLALTRKISANTITRPFSHVHKTLTTLGFIEKATTEGSSYELIFRDPMNFKNYTYVIPTETDGKGEMSVYLHEAAFKQRGEIPAEAFLAAQQVLLELKQYLSNHSPKIASTPIEVAQNGRMANTEKELKRLGNEMSKMPTNSQLKENGLLPDPAQ
jgi:hypothetical protein